MSDKQTLKVISEDGPPVILVEQDRVDEVLAILNLNRWPHIIDRDGIRKGDKTTVAVIQLGKDVDIPAVQAALDSLN